MRQLPNQTHVSQYNSFSPNQKSFLPQDGVFENNDVLDSFKSKKRDIFWIFLTLLDGHFWSLQACRCRKRESKVSRVGRRLVSKPLKAFSPQQGDPLSGVLFILTFNFILRKIRRDPGTKRLFHRILAYADDRSLLARPAEDLQALLYLINILAYKTGTKFNSKKCVTLHYSSKAGCRPALFNLVGVDIPFIEEGSPTTCLGKPVGVFLPRDTIGVEPLRQRESRFLLLSSLRGSG